MPDDEATQHLATIAQAAKNIEVMLREFLDMVAEEMKRQEAPETVPPSGSMEAGDSRL